MQKIDMAILVVGVVVLSAAIGGAALYGGASDLVDFTVKWDTHESELDAQQATIAGEGGEETVTFTVDQRNLTKATFTVTVQVPQTHLGGDDVTVAVKSPSGEEFAGTATKSASGRTVTIEVPAELGDMPSTARVEASSMDDAVSRLDADHGTDRGVGEWTVAVQVDHGGVNGFGSEHSVTVEAVLEHFEAHLTPPGGDVQGV